MREHRGTNREDLKKFSSKFIPCLIIGVIKSRLWRVWGIKLTEKPEVATDNILIGSSLYFGDLKFCERDS